MGLDRLLDKTKRTPCPEPMAKDKAEPETHRHEQPHENFGLKHQNLRGQGQAWPSQGREPQDRTGRPRTDAAVRTRPPHPRTAAS